MFPDVAGAEVRLRFCCAADQREPARAAAEEWKAKLLEAGAHSIKVEAETIATRRARVPELAKATSLPDKMQALWRSRDDVPDEGRQGRLFEKLQQLESEVSSG